MRWLFRLVQTLFSSKFKAFRVNSEDDEEAVEDVEEDDSSLCRSDRLEVVDDGQWPLLPDRPP